MQLNFQSFKKTIALFLPYILQNKSSRLRCIAALCIILIDILAATLVPYFSKQMVEGISFNIQNVAYLTIFFFGFFWTLEKVSSHIQEIIFFPVVNAAIQDISYRVVNHIHRLPLPVYQTLSMPEIISCTKRISPSARSFMKIFFLMLIPTSIKLIVMTTICCKMGSFGFAIVPALILSIYVLYKGFKVYIVSREHAWDATDTVIMRVNDSISNTKLTRPFLDQELQAVETLLKQEATLWYQTNIRLHSIHLFVGIIMGLSITLILFQAIHAIQSNALNLGDFIFLKGQLIAAFLPFKNVCLEFRQLIESLIDIKKVRALLELNREHHEESYRKQSGDNPHNNSIMSDIIPARERPHAWNSPSKINVDRITFFYDEKNPLILDLSLQVKEGEKITLIGSNGCGKSSLLGMIAGLFPPKCGRIMIQGLEKNTKLAFIPQDFRLFNQSLRENLLYGNKNVKISEIFDIIEGCGLSGIVKNAKFGLDTSVGEMGNLLSGGEKRRVALARALLHKPEILLLDETLDALNLENEGHLFKFLFAKISILINVSHHPLSRTMADKVFAFEAGRLRRIYADNQKTKSSTNRFGHRKSLENQGLSTYRL